MGDSLYDLEHLLRSKKKDKLSSQEANVLMACKANALRDFTVGAGVGGAIAWLATGKLRNLFRINLAGGVAAVTGLWRFGQSLNSCIEQILCMDGSRMQKELANIMLRKHPNDPLVTKLISKRFYCENVFDDSTSDTPKLRWRFRNAFVENAPHSQRTESQESHDQVVNIDSEQKTVSINGGLIAIENPYDCVFGIPPNVEEIRPTVSSTTSPKRRTHKQRRSRRRQQQMHSQDAAAGSPS